MHDLELEGQGPQDHITWGLFKSAALLHKMTNVPSHSIAAAYILMNKIQKLIIISLYQIYTTGAPLAWVRWVPWNP